MAWENHKLWGGQVQKLVFEKWVEEFGASISFDQRQQFDLKGSIAHVTMLGETGIITKEEALQIKQELGRTAWGI